MQTNFQCVLKSGGLVICIVLLVHLCAIFFSELAHTLPSPRATKTRSDHFWGTIHVDSNVPANVRNALVKAKYAGALNYHDDQDSIGSRPIPFAPFYKHIACITEKSDRPCSFPLLSDFHKRCGYFAESTSWKNTTKPYPEARMSAAICKVPPVTSAAQSLYEYITRRNITSILVSGDSQGHHYTNALIKLFEQLSFKCKKIKEEPHGGRIQLDYYTKGSGFKTDSVVNRACTSCRSNLRICTDRRGRKISIEYLSLIMHSKRRINLTASVCKGKTPHPLCLNLTQQEYVFKYYLNGSKHYPYPQLLLLFSAFPHSTFVPLHRAFDAIRYLVELLTSNVPESSAVIWYNAPPWHWKNYHREPPAEGIGLTPNDKVQILNHFLATVQVSHHVSQKKPALYSFFDLYHMAEQLKEEWAKDQVHSVEKWYRYVVGYTAALLPTIPLNIPLNREQP